MQYSQDQKIKRLPRVGDLISIEATSSYLVLTEPVLKEREELRFIYECELLNITKNVKSNWHFTKETLRHGVYLLSENNLDSPDI